MLKTRHGIIRLAAVVAGAVLFATCGTIGPSGNPDVPDYDSKHPPQLAHLEGKVVDFNTGAGIPDAKVTGEDKTWISGPDGQYVLSNLRSLNVALVVTAAGYDTTSSFIPLSHGHNYFLIRMKAAE